MASITALFIQLCGQFNGREAAMFCGKVVEFSLYCGNTAEETETLVQSLTTSAILGRVHGDRLRLIKELCPTMFLLVKDSVDKGAQHGVSFQTFLGKMI